jgi:putative transposase
MDFQNGVTAQMRREGVVNHKRVVRLMLQDNPLCLRRRPFVPMTTNSRQGWHVVHCASRGTFPLLKV